MAARMPKSKPAPTSVARPATETPRITNNQTRHRATANTHSSPNPKRSRHHIPKMTKFHQTLSFRFRNNGSKGNNSAKHNDGTTHTASNTRCTSTACK